MLPKTKPGLVPIGGGFYATPNRPQPPNYRNPFSRRPLAIEFRPVLDECNFGVEFNGVMAFMRLPAFQLVYRRQSPECNPTPEMYAEPQSAPPGENHIMGNGRGLLIALRNYRRTVIHDATGHIYTPATNSVGSTTTISQSFTGTGRINGNRYVDLQTTTTSRTMNFGISTGSSISDGIMRIIFDSSETTRYWILNPGAGLYTDFWYRVMNSSETYIYTVRTSEDSWHGSYIKNFIDIDFWGSESSVSDSRYYIFIPLGDILLPPPPPPKFKEMEKCCRETLGLLRVINKKLGTLPTEIPNGDEKPIKVQSLTDLHLIEIARFEEKIGSLPIELVDEKDKEKKKKINSLVQLHIEQFGRIQHISTKIGDLPAKVPDLITKESPSEIEIESLGELLLWQIKQLDATMGKFPIKIKIRDTDSTKEGDQSQEITVPNTAEAISELLGLALTIKRDTHANVVLGMKILPQAGMATKLAQMGLDVGLACAEFLGFSLIQKKKKIPLLFTPGATDLDDLLKEKEVEYLCYENVEKTDLMDHIRKILEMVARWTAQNWRRVDFRDPGSSVLANLYGGIDGMRKGKKENEQEDFDNFTEQAEKGFINTVGISDTENPWGDDFDARPRIREIGEDKIKEQ